MNSLFAKILLWFWATLAITILVSSLIGALTQERYERTSPYMRAAGRVLSRDALMEHLYNRKATPFDRSIDMHVSHLRRKLETDRPLIKTVRGVGYQFCRTPAEAVE